MKKHFTFLILLFLGLTAKAQINHGGQPYDWKDKTAKAPPFIRLPAPDLDALRKEDEEWDAYKEIPYRFGANIPVDFDLNNSGEWKELPNGDRVWRLGIESTGALTINFQFDKYEMPAGAKVFVYAPQKQRLLGSFTRENTSAENSLGVGFVFSDQIVISYYEPAEVAGQGYLHINQVTHGYRNAFMGIKGLEKTGEFGQSGPCNINVNCPEGLPYGIQKRSVALIIVNGNSHCSGALINTTANDETPYLLTANHCLSSDPATWVFYFNYETPTCSNDGDIPQQSVSGGTTKANNMNSDFGLILLSNDVPDSYNSCFSGWDASDNPDLVLSGYAIHHPRGDIKKISIEEDAPYQATLGGFANEVWYIDQWELGVTEGGSSGSPLFNQSGKIIGQLAGGQAACSGSVNNGEFDFFGRLGVSWDFGDSPSTRLKDWLDPANTGQMQMTNSCNQSIPNDDISLGTFGNLDQVYCTFTDLSPTINVVNVGGNAVSTFTLHIFRNGSPLDDVVWNGTLESYQSVSLSLGTIVPLIGSNEIKVEVATVNTNTDVQEIGNMRSIQTTVFTVSEVVNLDLDFDDYAEETSWKIVDANDSTIYSGDGYAHGENIINLDLCLGEGCYTFQINDSEGDGICCFYGEGSYVLTNANNDTLAMGAQFGTEESTDFCLTPVGVEDHRLQTISLFPNPASDKVTISFGDTSETIQSVTLLDAVGREVKKVTPDGSQSKLELNTDVFNDGVYFISIKTDIGTTVRRLVVME